MTPIATSPTNGFHIPNDRDTSTQRRFNRIREFDLHGKVYAVTGGARGLGQLIPVDSVTPLSNLIDISLGLAMAEALAEAGGEVHCLDRLRDPHKDFYLAKERTKLASEGSLYYIQVDVRDTKEVEKVMQDIASYHDRLDGLIAAAGVNHVDTALNHCPQDIEKVMSINYTGVFHTAVAAAKQMFRYKIQGSIVLVGSMSGIIANKGMNSPVYNSSKAAVIQLARNLAMEWGHIDEEGRGGIRVNSLCPGHIMTPMVEETLRESKPGVKKLWESENMLGRLARPQEFRGAALFLLSEASSFMTGAQLTIDGGHTAW